MVEIPSPKTVYYIGFLCHSTSNGMYVQIIRECHDANETGSAQKSLKSWRSPPLNLIYSCFLCHSASNGIYVKIIWECPDAHKQEVPKYLDIIEIPTPKP